MERGGTGESLLSVVASGSFREKREISGVFGGGGGGQFAGRQEVPSHCSGRIGYEREAVQLDPGDAHI